jgi:hypothetical protein
MSGQRYKWSIELFENLKSKVSRKSTAFIAAAALLFVGVSAQASGILNTPAGGYLVCVDTKTGAVTHPGTSKCKKGQKRLVLGAQGPVGATGANGQDGLVGASGLPGSNGNTLWTGQGEPSNTLGIPGDSYLDLVGKKIHAPKASDGTWPIGISIVGPQGPQGPGGSGPAGPAGPAGAQGPAGVSAPVATGANCIGTKCTYKIGDTGPGGGIIFFVDYHDVYPDFKYLEASNFDECFDGEEFDVLWTSDPDSQSDVHFPTAGDSAWRVGSGTENTAAMLETITVDDNPLYYIGDTSGAAAFADNFICGGKTDWFLGSLGEMKLLLEASLEVNIENTTEMTFWTSTSAGYDLRDSAFVVDLGLAMRRADVPFSAGLPSVYTWSKDEALDIAVRPIRQF